MNAITELALMLKQRDNPRPYCPIIGEITELPHLKVRLNSKAMLDDKQHIKIKCVAVDQTDEQGRYINVGRQAVLLPYGSDQKYILIGLVE